MKLIEMKFPKLIRAKNIAISKKYLLFTTGKKVLIFDKKFQLIQEIDGLRYCYKAIISPDEKSVLLISNLNHFKILSLNTFEISRHTIKGEYSGNLEGRGCWAFDGNKVLLCVYDEQSMLSALRTYDLENESDYSEALCDKYWLTNIMPIDAYNKYLLTGFNRNNHKNYLIWYDGTIFEEYCLENFDDVIVKTEYDKQNLGITIYGLEKSLLCDYYGNRLEKIAIAGKEIEMDNVLSSKNICDGKYICIGTHEYLYCYDVKYSQLVFQKKILYGVHDIVEMEDNILLISTWNGIKVFKIVLQ